MGRGRPQRAKASDDVSARHRTLDNLGREKRRLEQNQRNVDHEDMAERRRHKPLRTRSKKRSRTAHENTSIDDD